VISCIVRFFGARTPSFFLVWRCMAGRLVPDVWGQHSGIETSGTNHPVTHQHIAEDRRLQLHGHQTVKSRKHEFVVNGYYYLFLSPRLFVLAIQKLQFKNMQHCHFFVTELGLLSR